MGLSTRECKKIVISGGTERQKQILENMGITCELFECNELPDMEFKELQNEMKLQEIANFRGRKAAKQLVSRTRYNFVIISVETAVIFNKRILKTPKTRAQAVRILKSLSGNTHKVASGLCVWWGQKGVTVCDETYVKFRELTAEEIEHYVDTENYSFSGGYDILGGGAKLIESIEGSFWNVAGVPVNKIYEILDEEYLFKLFENTECGMWNKDKLSDRGGII